MGVILWILVGLVLGSVARLIMPGPSAGGMLVAIFVGIGGAMIGGLIGTFSAENASTVFDLRSLLMAFIGSMILLLGYRAYALRVIEG